VLHVGGITGGREGGYRGGAEGEELSNNPLLGTIDEIAAQAERILVAIVPGAWCQAQEYDNRIDCGVTQPDGKAAVEMISLEEATEERIKATGERLLQRKKGIPVPLQNEFWSIFIGPHRKPSDPN